MDDTTIENTAHELPEEDFIEEQQPRETWFDRNLQGDKFIWMVIIALAAISVLVVYSATGTIAYKNQQGSTHYLVKHSILVFTSLIAIWVTHRIDYRYYSRLSRVALLISVPLLIVSWQFGSKINEASRWITIPIINQSFQTSDLAKLALLATLASMLAKRQRSIDDFKDAIMPILFWVGIICGLIGLTDISSALLLFATCLVLMFIGRVPINYLILLVVVGFISISASLYMGQRAGTFRSRIAAKYTSSEIPFQAQQSYIAIATGGITGVGAGNSVQRNFLPNPYSDFIFAIIIEEYGLLGGLVVLVLYLVLLYRGMLVVANSKRPFGGILSAGLVFSIVIQALINMAVSVGLVPITGMPMPLLSMGGTSLLFTGIALGIVLSISRGEVDEDIDKIGKVAKTGNVKRDPA
ncbi:MAG TPA: cell division protein FtsW [Microscillaceae bacterium]|nr:cell division protein FtsW [Microscillaceae bacterium]